MRSVVWSVLALLVAMNAIIPIVNRYHYTADVAVSLLLSVLLYSSPAIAIVAERWAQVSGRDAAPGTHSVAQELFGLDLEVNADREAAGDEAVAMDIGQVLAVPCGPWCCDDPVYYLRSQPGRLATPGQEQQDGSTELQLQEQLTHFTGLEEEGLRRMKQNEEMLQSEREKARRHAVEAGKTEEWKLQGLLADETRRLEAEEKKQLEDVKRRLSEERKKSADRKEKVVLEATLRQECERLEESAQSAQQELEYATRACQQYEADIAETRRKVQEACERPAQADVKLNADGEAQLGTAELLPES